MNDRSTTSSGTTASTPVVAFIPPSCCGAGYFHRLRRALGGRIDVRAVELPGHGRRYDETPLTRAELAVAEVVDQLGGGVDAIYGESLGAYIGLAVAAAARQDPPPLLFAASNSPPSTRQKIDAEQIRSIDSAVALLTSMGGEIPAEIVRDPELADRFFPMIRGDLHLSQSFIDATRAMTTAGGIQVLAGADDTASVHLASWAAHTTGRFGLTVLPGGHLLSAGNPSGVADVILHLLKEDLDGDSRRTGSLDRP